jgi:hypothetical protein
MSAQWTSPKLHYLALLVKPNVPSIWHIFGKQKLHPAASGFACSRKYFRCRTCSQFVCFVIFVEASVAQFQFVLKKKIYLMNFSHRSVHTSQREQYHETTQTEETV